MQGTVDPFAREPTQTAGPHQSLNMRTYPLIAINLWDRPGTGRTGRRIVATLSRGTPVTILEARSDGWARVRAETGGGAVEGWVHKTFLLEQSGPR